MPAPPNTMHPRIAVIILHWNHRHLIEACLGSLWSAQMQNAFTVVVDNGSSDDSVAFIRREFPETVVIENKRNLSFAEGNNRGIREALRLGAEAVLLLNNDTEVAPGFLAPLVERLYAAHTGAVGPKLHYFSEPQKIWYAGGEIDFRKGTFRHRGIREQDTGQYNEPCATGYVTGCALLVRREVLDQVGLLDPRFWAYAEDADWCQRIKEAGWDLWYEPRSVVYHKISSSSGGQFTFYKMYHRLRGALLFFRRYSKPSGWFRILAAQIPEAMRILSLRLQGELGPR